MTRAKPRVVSGFTAARLLELEARHGSFAAVARALGLPSGTVRAAASRLGVRSWARGSRRLDATAFPVLAARMLAEGASQADIARRWGVTRQAVQKRLGRLNGAGEGVG